MSREEAAPEAAIRLDWGAATDAGLRRSINEDSYLAEHPLFLVADGMGGHEAGEVASAKAIAAFVPLIGCAALTVADVRVALASAVAGVRALATGSAESAGTTISGVVVTEHDDSPYWMVINLGDSRTYLLSGGTLEQVSVDHSLVQELVDSGELAAERMRTDPRRNVITRAIGAGSDGEADYWLIPVNLGDRILICSDGLSGELDDEHLAAVLSEETSAQAAATRLVHEALLHGGRDNVTVVVVDVLDLPGGDDINETYEVDIPADGFDDTVPRSREMVG